MNTDHTASTQHPKNTDSRDQTDYENDWLTDDPEEQLQNSIDDDYYRSAGFQNR